MSLVRHADREIMWNLEDGTWQGSQVKHAIMAGPMLGCQRNIRSGSFRRAERMSGHANDERRNENDRQTTQAHNMNTSMTVRRAHVPSNHVIHSGGGLRHTYKPRINLASCQFHSQTHNYTTRAHESTRNSLVDNVSIVHVSIVHVRSP